MRAYMPEEYVAAFEHFDVEYGTREGETSVVDIDLEESGARRTFADHMPHQHVSDWKV